MSTADAIRAVLRERVEVERVELPYLAGRDEADVRAALDTTLAGEVDVDYAGFVSLAEPTPKAASTRPPRGITAASLRPEAERRARVASEIPDVVAYREAELGGELLDNPAEWIEQREGSPPYTGALEYVRPDSEWVARVGTSSGDALERLRVLSESLATRFGWLPPFATTFVLTGWTPPLSTGRRTWRQTFTPDGPLPPKSTHERFTADDAEAFADAHRAARVSAGVTRRQPSDTAAKYAALVPFVDARRPPATWDAIHIQWSAAYPEWRFSRADKLADAYRGALAA